MVLEFAQGNLAKANVQAIVNTVNLCGASGAGVALQMKHVYPDVFRAYKEVCFKRRLTTGQVQVVRTGADRGAKWVINFPTMTFWRGRSDIKYIKTGLRALMEAIRRFDIKSVAIPPLGCTNGKLQWDVVCPLIVKAMQAIPDVHVLLYRPGDLVIPKEQSESIIVYRSNVKVAYELVGPVREIISLV